MMTETIEALAELRAQNVRLGDSFAEKAAGLSRQAADAAASAEHYLAKAADLSGILRDVDPEHAQDYPDPRVATWRLVAELRGLADLVASSAVPPEHGGMYVQLRIHGLEPADARALAARMSASAPSPAETQERSSCLDIVYGSEQQIEITLYARRPFADEPVNDPAAIEERQALDADPSPVDPAAAAALIERGIVGYAAYLREVDPCAETAEHAVLPRPSREVAPIQVGDRVRIRRVDASENGFLKAFPDELEGREGTVTEVDAHAFVDAPDAGAADDPPIVVRVDGEGPTHCFAVVEVEVLVRIEDAEQLEPVDALAGQPA